MDGHGQARTDTDWTMKEYAVPQAAPQSAIPNPQSPIRNPQSPILLLY